MFTNIDGFEYNLYANPVDAHTPQYIEPQPAIINSIEFMDLTAPQHEDRRRRRSTTAQDKETISNMRIVSHSTPATFNRACPNTRSLSSADVPKTVRRNGPFGSAKRSTCSILKSNWKISRPSTAHSQSPIQTLTARTTSSSARLSSCGVSLPH